MKLLIATGVYPPEIGGPAYYAAGLNKALSLLGHSVEIASYGSLKRLPTGVRHVLFGVRALPAMLRADVIVALDTFSVGVPIAFCNLFLRKPLVVRIAGDFLWEMYMGRTNHLVPLPRFYQEHQPFTRKEKIIFTCTNFVLKHTSRIVFSTSWLQDIWRKAYDLAEERVKVIENAVEKRERGVPPSKKNFLWFTRDIPLKNGPVLRAAFAEVQSMYPDIELETGQTSQDELLEKIRHCYAVVLPSISDVSPNYILDALSFGKPFIMTKYSGYADWLAPYGVLVDPLDTADIVRGIKLLANDATYKEYAKKAASFQKERSYEDVARDLLKNL